MNIQDMVNEFHQTFNRPIGDKANPQLLSPEQTRFRWELLREEFEDEYEIEVFHENPDLAKLADALGDMVYIIYGTALEHGIDLNAVITEIHRSNMTKLDKNSDPIYREDGKVLKSDLYEPPDIEGVIYGFTGTPSK